MQFVLDNSMIIIFSVMFVILGISEYRRYLRQNQLSFKASLLRLESRTKDLTRDLLGKFAASIVVAALISMVSFRELFTMDVFHTVFLASLLLEPAQRRLSYLFRK